MNAPVLRSPIFPGVDAAVSRSSAVASAVDLAPEAIERLFAALREARVGGCFWARPCAHAGADRIIRARSVDDVAAVPTLPGADHRAVLWLVPSGTAGRAIAARIGSAANVAGEVDPWSVLDARTTLHAHGDDEWVALVTIAGGIVHILTPGRFGTPGMAPADVQRRVARDLMTTQYRNPFDGGEATIAATIALLADWRRLFAANRGIVAACGFSWWKRREIARFLWTPEHRVRFFRSEPRAIVFAAKHGGAVAVWPSRVSAEMAASAAARHVPVVRVEDGFVRSAGLGSNLVPPSSVAIDRRGIHYDPGSPSDLEALLAGETFPAALLNRASALHETILAAGISKYGSDGGHAFPPRDPARRLVLVPGQVEDDMSVRLGGGGLASNLELLRRTRALEPGAEIWFRPHPDVDAGHRKGAVRDTAALDHADRIVRGGGMAALLGQIDAVHVLTSLTGFEALLRGRDVTCHGTPFYAGWGLTRDLAPTPARRGRTLTLEALIAAVLILYPRYLDPVTGLPCSPEVLIERLRGGTARNRLGWISHLRQWQGRLTRRRA